MALRDPRNKSRNNASRRTSSSSRSKRSATSSKYNPRPTSSQQRSGKTGTGSNRVTTGSGGQSRLTQALDSLKVKKTPPKTKPGKGGLIGALTTGAQVGNAMTQNLSRRATPSNRGAGRATENVKAGPPKKEERATKGPTPKPTPKKPLPVQKEPIKAPPKKGSTVLAKQKGKEGVLRNGVFYPTGWSPAQRNRYQIQRKKDTK